MDDTGAWMPVDATPTSYGTVVLYVKNAHSRLYRGEVHGKPWHSGQKLEEGEQLRTLHNRTCKYHNR